MSASSLEKNTKMALALAVFIVAVANLQVTTAAVSRREIEEMLPIIFPGPVEPNDFKMHNKMNEEPDECKGKTYCTIKPADYPEEKFNKMFKGANTLAQPSLVLDSMLTNRQGDPEETDDCDSEVKYEPLYKVRSKRDGDWRYVVQAPQENYVQRVRLETCTNPEATCFNALHLNSNIKTYCKQKYNKWEVLVAKGEKETEKIEVELPVCCSCVYKTAPIESRFGVDKKMTPAKPSSKP